jgi:hypothetical protein
VANYDISNTTKMLLDFTLPGRAEVVTEVGELIRNTSRIYQLIVEIDKEARAQGLDKKPFDILKIALCYGATIGIFMEQEIQHYFALTGKMEYSMDYVVREFLRDGCPDQTYVMAEVAAEFRVQPCVYHLVSTVAEEVAKQQANPYQSVLLALLYGCVLGIFLEKERSKKLVN